MHQNTDAPYLYRKGLPRPTRHAYENGVQIFFKAWHVHGNFLGNPEKDQNGSHHQANKMGYLETRITEDKLHSQE